MSFLKAPKKVEALLCLFNQGGGVYGPGEIIGDVDAKELEAGHTLHCSSVDGDGGVCLAPGPPEVHDDLLGFLGVECQVVVSTPRGQVPYFLPVGRLIVTSDQAYHRGVICELNYGIGTIDWSAVMGE